MPPKKKHRGGRPKGEYGNLDEEQKRLYHREAVRAHLDSDPSEPKSAIGSAGNRRTIDTSRKIQRSAFPER